MLARIVDFIFFRLLIAFVLFLVLIYFSRSTTVSVLISIFTTTAFSLILLIFSRKKVSRYIEQDLKRIKEKCLLEALTFMTIDEYAEYLNVLLGGLEDVQVTDMGFTAKMDDAIICAFHNHPSDKCGVSHVLHVLREFFDKSLVLVSLSEFDENAKKLCAHSGQVIELLSGSRILELAAEKDMLPNEEDAAERAKMEMNESITTLDKVRETTLSRAKVKRYVICGVIVMLWPLVTGFQVYYPIIAMLCFVLAILAYRKSRIDQESPDILT